MTNVRWNTVTRSVGVGLFLAAMASACGGNPETRKHEYLARGDQYMREDKEQAAIIEYRNALQQDARFAEAYRKLAAAYWKAGDHAGALRASVAAADLLPRSADAQLEAGNLLLLAGRFDEAKSRATKALDDDPRSSAARMLLGNATVGLKDPDTAIEQFEEAIRLDPQQSSGYQSLAAIQAATDDRQAAEKNFKEAIARAPDSASPRLALGQFYWMSGRAAEAEQVLKETIAAAPNDTRVLTAFAAFLRATGRVGEAEPYLRHAVDLDRSPAAKIVLGDYYVSAGRYQDAVRIFESVKDDPKIGTIATLRLARVDEVQGHLDRARQSVDRILSSDPKNSSALALRSDLLRRTRNPAGALAAAQAAVQADPDSVLGQFVLGLALEALARREDAKEAFNNVLKLNPHAAAAQVELARLNLAGGAADASVALAVQAAKTDPRSVDARLVLARGLMARRDYSRAQSVLGELLQAAPDVAVVHAELGTLRLLQKDRTGASAEFSRALDLDPLQLEAIGGLTALDLAEGRRDQAFARLAALVERAPRNDRLLVLAGRAYFSSHDFGRAEAMLNRAVQANPNAIDAYSLLAQVYLVQKRLDAARTELLNMAQRQERPVSAWTMVGMIDQMQNRVPDARRSYERALEIDPHAGVAANNLAWIHADTGENLDAALRLARDAKAALPKSAEVDDTLGWIFYKKGLFQQAIESIARSVEREASNPLFSYHLGLAYEKAGDRVRARQFLKKALLLQPDFPGAAEAVRLVDSSAGVGKARN